MPKNLRGKDAIKDALMIAHAKLITLVRCINMNIYIRSALKPNVPSGKVHTFTDSLLNLQRGLGKCKPWEEKRVQLILENQGESSISFCPGELNPATCQVEVARYMNSWKDFLFGIRVQIS